MSVYLSVFYHFKNNQFRIYKKAYQQNNCRQALSSRFTKNERKLISSHLVHKISECS